MKWSFDDWMAHLPMICCFIGAALGIIGIIVSNIFIK